MLDLTGFASTRPRASVRDTTSVVLSGVTLSSTRRSASAIGTRPIRGSKQSFWFVEVESIVYKLPPCINFSWTVSALLKL